MFSFSNYDWFKIDFVIERFYGKNFKSDYAYLNSLHPEVSGNTRKFQ